MNEVLTVVASLIPVVLWLAAGWAAAVCLLRGWSRTLLSARSRLMLITGVIDAVILLAVVRALSPPPGAWSWLWVAACSAVGLGAAGALRRWSELPLVMDRRPGKRPGRRVRGLLTVLYAVVGAGVVIVMA